MSVVLPKTSAHVKKCETDLQRERAHVNERERECASMDKSVDVI